MFVKICLENTLGIISKEGEGRRKGTQDDPTWSPPDETGEPWDQDGYVVPEEQAQPWRVVQFFEYAVYRVSATGRYGTFRLQCFLGGTQVIRVCTQKDLWNLRASAFLLTSYIKMGVSLLCHTLLCMFCLLRGFDKWNCLIMNQEPQKYEPF